MLISFDSIPVIACILSMQSRNLRLSSSTIATLRSAAPVFAAHDCIELRLLDVADRLVCGDHAIAVELVGRTHALQERVADVLRYLIRIALRPCRIRAERQVHGLPIFPRDLLAALWRPVTTDKVDLPRVPGIAA